MMGFDLLAEAEFDGFRAIRKSNSRQGQYNGACLLPGCSGTGTDRLRIQPNQGDYGWFACSVCGGKGNGIDWLMQVRSMGKNEALQYVGWQPRDGSTPNLTRPKNILDQCLARRSEQW